MSSSQPEGVSFYGGPFSNFVRSPIKLPHPFVETLVIYPTVEHRFQAMKATNEEDHDLIGVRGTPAEAKHKGRRIKLRPDWEEVKYAVMLEALCAKFHLVEFQKSLVDTGEAYIYENSPTDACWGLWNPRKGDWSGENLLGKALMEVRDAIREGNLLGLQYTAEIETSPAEVAALRKAREEIERGEVYEKP